MKRVAIIEPILTHYRQPVFLELATYCQVDLIFSPLIPDSGYGTVANPQVQGVRYFEIPILRPFGPRVGMMQWGLGKYVLRENPNLIMASANPRYLSFWTLLIVARLRRIPTYVHGHGLYKKRRIGFFYRMMTHLLLRLVTSYIAYAPIVRESFLAHGFSGKKIAVAHNSLVNRFTVRPEEKTGNERGILFIGRLRPDSNLDLLLRVVKRLRDQDDLRLTLHVIGSGEAAKWFRDRAEECPWVSWHGEVYDHGQIRNISRDCFLGCYPGNAGLSVVHLMSLSLPVVTHDDIPSHGPEPSFIRNGVSGIVFDHANPEDALYQALKQLATEPARLARMQRAAFEDYERLSNPSLALRLWSILGEGLTTSSEYLSPAPPRAEATRSVTADR